MNIIFNSITKVYGGLVEIPIIDNCPKGVCTNHYG